MNRAAIITGATSGIGKAVAQAFHKNHIRCALTGRNESALKEIASQTNSVYLASDVNAPDLPQRLIDLSIQTYGQCDLLVNNAGTIETGAIESIDVERVTEMVRANVEAAFRFTYVFLKHCKTQGSGHLINMSSVLGTKVRETAGAYAGTKFAVEALSEALRIELSKTDIQITCIEPGLVKTELHRRWEKHPSELMDIPNPLKPEDVADTILYVLSQPFRVRIPRIMVLPKDHVI